MGLFGLFGGSEDTRLQRLEAELAMQKERTTRLERRVEALADGDPAAWESLDQDDLAEVRSLLLQGEEIGAIKEYRSVRDVGLAEAKRAVDLMERDLRG